MSSPSLHDVIRFRRREDALGQPDGIIPASVRLQIATRVYRLPDDTQQLNSWWNKTKESITLQCPRPRPSSSNPSSTFPDVPGGDEVRSDEFDGGGGLRGVVGGGEEAGAQAVGVEGGAAGVRV